jgi:hypothetical protein
MKDGRWFQRKKLWRGIHDNPAIIGLTPLGATRISETSIEGGTIPKKFYEIGIPD